MRGRRSNSWEGALAEIGWRPFAFEKEKAHETILEKAREEKTEKAV